MQDYQAMNDRPAETPVTAFLKGALADAAVDVPKLQAMARAAGLLGERQRITNAKPFRRAKSALGIQSVRCSMATTPEGSQPVMQQQEQVQPKKKE
jgi:hypothetical protein